MNIPQRNKIIIGLTVLVIGTGFISGCGPSKKEKEEQQQTVEQEDALDTPTVILVPVKKGRLTANITVPGELQPYQQVDVFAKLSSYVKTLLVDIGSQVTQGQLMAVLEAPEINSQLAEAKSRISQNRAIYFADKATYDRLVNTAKTPGTISPNDIEQAAAKKSSDSANVEAAKSAYKEVEAQLAYLQIRAPFTGVITVRNINLGTYVGPGSGNGNQPLFVVEDHKRLRLVISIPENYTGGLKDKDEVSFTIKERQGKTYKAQVVRLAGALDEQLRSERLEMDVYNTDNSLLPNMYADVNVPLPARDSALLVPKSAVVTSTERVFVIKIVDNKAKWVDVEKGLQSGDVTEVYTKGLKPGDQVVKSGSEEIRDGSPIKRGTEKEAADAAKQEAKASADTVGKGKKKKKDDNSTSENPNTPATGSSGADAVGKVKAGPYGDTVAKKPAKKKK